MVGPLTAAVHFSFPPDILAMIMHDLFGGVVYAGIDTDRYKYPIGSGRVTFGNLKSFMKAVKSGFVEIKTPKFSKKVCRGFLLLICSFVWLVCPSVRPNLHLQFYQFACDVTIRSPYRHYSC
jgi:hypothetical protein